MTELPNTDKKVRKATTSSTENSYTMSPTSTSFLSKMSLIHEVAAGIARLKVNPSVIDTIKKKVKETKSFEYVLSLDEETARGWMLALDVKEAAEFSDYVAEKSVPTLCRIARRATTNNPHAKGDTNHIFCIVADPIFLSHPPIKGVLAYGKESVSVALKFFSLVKSEDANAVVYNFAHSEQGCLIAFNHYCTGKGSRVRFFDDTTVKELLRTCPKPTAKLKCYYECPSQKLRRCTGCDNIWYCSKACQIKHWPVHSKACNDIKAHREREKSSTSSPTTNNNNSTTSDKGDTKNASESTEAASSQLK